MSRPSYNLFDINLSELHAKRWMLYQKRAKYAQKLAKVDKELKDIEAKLAKLHKDNANEQSNKTPSLES